MFVDDTTAGRLRREQPSSRGGSRTEGSPPPPSSTSSSQAPTAGQEALEPLENAIAEIKPGLKLSDFTDASHLLLYLTFVKLDKETGGHYGAPDIVRESDLILALRDFRQLVRNGSYKDEAIKCCLDEVRIRRQFGAPINASEIEDINDALDYISEEIDNAWRPLFSPEEMSTRRAEIQRAINNASSTSSTGGLEVIESAINKVNPELTLSDFTNAGDLLLFVTYAELAKNSGDDFVAENIPERSELEEKVDHFRNLAGNNSDEQRAIDYSLEKVEEMRCGQVPINDSKAYLIAAMMAGITLEIEYAYF